MRWEPYIRQHLAATAGRRTRCSLSRWAAVETSVAAQTTLELPAMGKLSYLKALVPAVQLADDSRALPFALAAEEIDRVRQDLQRKQLDRSIQTIKLGSSFVEEVRAVVWRPWWVAEVQASGASEVLLSTRPRVRWRVPELSSTRRCSSSCRQRREMRARPCVFSPCSARPAGSSFVMRSMRCCISASTAIDCSTPMKPARPRSSTSVRSKDRRERCDIVPFWRFPLRLATTDQRVITDLMHLKDGIDGTLDQIGEGAQPGQDDLWIPAIRCINTRLMAAAFSRLFVFAARNPPQARKGRFPLDIKVAAVARVPGRRGGAVLRGAVSRQCLRTPGHRPSQHPSGDGMDFRRAAQIARAIWRICRFRGR